jgi:hypothetical protein
VVRETIRLGRFIPRRAEKVGIALQVVESRCCVYSMTDKVFRNVRQQSQTAWFLQIITRVSLANLHKTIEAMPCPGLVLHINLPCLLKRVQNWSL